MKKVHSILSLVMVGAIALLSCNNGPSEEEKQKRMQDSLDSVQKAQAAAPAPTVNQDSIDKANAAKTARLTDSLKKDSMDKAKGAKKGTTVVPVKKGTTPVKPTKPAKPANSTKTDPAPTPPPAPAPKKDDGFEKKGTGDNKGGSGFEKKGDTKPAGDGKTTPAGGNSGFQKK